MLRGLRGLVGNGCGLGSTRECVSGFSFDLPEPIIRANMHSRYGETRAGAGLPQSKGPAWIRGIRVKMRLAELWAAPSPRLDSRRETEATRLFQFMPGSGRYGRQKVGPPLGSRLSRVRRSRRFPGVEVPATAPPASLRRPPPRAAGSRSHARGSGPACLRRRHGCGPCRPEHRPSTSAVAHSRRSWSRRRDMP